jgi:hypothetical protein
LIVPTAQRHIVGRVLVGKPFRPHEHERLALLDRQLLERAPEVGERQPPVVRRLLGDLLGQHALGIRHFAPRLAALRVEGVAQDREEPCAHVGPGLELVDVGPRLYDRVLHEIVGTRHVPRQRQREGAHRLEVHHDLVARVERARILPFRQCLAHRSLPSSRSLWSSSRKRSGILSSTISS